MWSDGGSLTRLASQQVLASQAAGDDKVRVAVLAGDGPDFCAGNDISMFADSASGKQDISGSNVDPFLRALSTFPKPLVAIVRGRAIGVGVTLLLQSMSPATPNWSCPLPTSAWCRRPDRRGCCPSGLVIPGRLP